MFTDLFKFNRSPTGGAIETRRIEIKGMTCRNCEHTVKKALLTKNGVKKVYLNRETGVAEVSFDSAQTNVQELGDAVLRKGYFPKVVEE